MQRKFVFCATAGAMMAFTSPVLASETSQGQMRISVRVPALCTVSSANVTVDPEGDTAASTFFESCNTNRGFQLIATHRPLVQAETARVTYDGVDTSLQDGGFSPLQFRQGARYGPVAVRVSGDRLTEPLSVSFAMTPV